MQSVLNPYAAELSLVVLLIERIVLQTNSTVTTKILQQASSTPIVLFGIPLTDWITAITGVFVALFAIVTVLEGRKNRRKDSIEKKLERLYNPLFELLDAFARHGHTRQMPEFVEMRDENYRAIVVAFRNYGHYLSHDEHESVKRLVSEAWEGEAGRTHLKMSNIDACLPLIAGKRAELKKKLEGLV